MAQINSSAWSLWELIIRFLLEKNIRVKNSVSFNTVMHIASLICIHYTTLSFYVTFTNKQNPSHCVFLEYLLQISANASFMNVQISPPPHVNA